VVLWWLFTLGTAGIYTGVLTAALHAMVKEGERMASLDRRLIIIIVSILLFSTANLRETIWSQGPTPTPTMPFMVPYFAPPEHLELCGEEVPLTLQDVKERLDREFTIVVHSHAQVFLWLKRMQRYFPWLEKEIERNGLPNDLKYVAVAESDLQVLASSPAGAVGPWQFMRGTGVNYGLGQMEGLDERRDFECSTQSAFRYLRDLHARFQNWTLAVASYNCGENRVQDEMKRQKVNSYYGLKLPAETERYVFRILAIKEVLSHPEKYGYFLPEGAGYPTIATERIDVTLPCPVPIQTMAEFAGITYRDFKNLNPAFVSDTVPGGARTLRVPPERSKDFLSRYETFKSGGHQGTVLHKVEKGETLSGIAAHYGVSLSSLREGNGLQGDKVRVGQVIKIVK
jgi:membrane-bound lytic murein transglycosylase D